MSRVRWSDLDIALSYALGAAVGVGAAVEIWIGIAFSVAWLVWVLAMRRLGRRDVERRHQHVYSPFGGIETGYWVEDACHEAGEVATWRWDPDKGRVVVEVRPPPWFQGRR